MSGIQRSLKNVTGDLTVTDGDVKITDPTSGVVMNDGADDQRMTVVQDAGQATIDIEAV